MNFSWQANSVQFVTWNSGNNFMRLKLMPQVLHFVHFNDLSTELQEDLWHAIPFSMGQLKFVV